MFMPRWQIITQRSMKRARPLTMQQADTENSNSQSQSLTGELNKKKRKKCTHYENKLITRERASS